MRSLRPRLTGLQHVHFLPMNKILIIAHAPFAQALRACALHVFPDCAQQVQALDVPADEPCDKTFETACALAPAEEGGDLLVLTDVFGATPCNVAQRLVDGVQSRLVAGLNLPMLLRSITYRHEPLEALLSRATAGGTQGVMQVAITAPQNQARRNHDQDRHDHHQ